MDQTVYSPTQIDLIDIILNERSHTQTYCECIFEKFYYKQNYTDTDQSSYYLG